MLFHHCGDDARHADAVTPHHHRVLLAVGVGVVHVERLRVLGAELEHVSDFDAAVDRERLAAVGARIARHDRDEVGPDDDGEVAPEDGVDPAGIPYELVLPDGARRKGVFDASGRVRVEGVAERGDVLVLLTPTDDRLVPGVERS